jgi:hypothetical protein
MPELRLRYSGGAQLYTSELLARNRRKSDIKKRNVNDV